MGKQIQLKNNNSGTVGTVDIINMIYKIYYKIYRLCRDLPSLDARDMAENPYRMATDSTALKSNVFL